MPNGMMMGGEAPTRTKWKPPVREGGATPDNVGDLYGDVDPAIQDMISGDAFSPVKMQMQSAMDRMQRTKRQSAARSPGFLGGGMGRQQAQDVESGLAGDRLQGILDIGVGEQAMRERGITAKMGMIGQQEEIRMGRERLDLAKLDQKQRHELAVKAQALNDKIQSGQLSIAQARVEMERVMNDFSRRMGEKKFRLGERSVRYPQELEHAKLTQREEARDRISFDYDAFDYPKPY